MCHADYAERLLAGSGWNILIPLASSQQNLYDIYLLLCVQYYTHDDGQKTRPKHVEFYSKNKLEKIVHLVGFILRIRIIIPKLYLTKRSLSTINGVASALPAGRPGVRIPVRLRFFENVKTGCGTQPSSYSLCTGVRFRTKSANSRS
jgi:hypothetical protein